jgi:hypothetical protein
MRENHIMKILVKALAPLADPAIVRCTSDADFLVYGATNGAGDCVIETRSTGASVDTHSPTFTVGGVANDLVIVLVTPGTKGFLTLQTANGATASLK